MTMPHASITRHCIATLLIALPIAAAAQDPASVPAPRFRADSTWTFHSVGGQGSRIAESDTQWRLVGQNSDGDWIFWRGKPTPSAPASRPVITVTTGVTSPSWEGRDTTGNEDRNELPLSFPLAAGKTWDVVFDHQIGAVWAHGERHYRAIGWEDVTVPAGRFRALRIDMDGGNWRIDPPHPGQAGARPQRAADLSMTQQSWYVPGVQNVVREIDDATAPNIASHRHYVMELTGYTLAP